MVTRISTEHRTTTPRPPAAHETPMPAAATGNLFMLASGFGIGALVVLGAFVFLIGIGQFGNSPPSGTPAAQSASTQPAAPGPSPNPVPTTSGQAAPETTGQAPAQGNRPPAQTNQAPAQGNPETQDAPAQQR